MSALWNEATCRLGKKAATYRRTPNLLWAGPISAPEDRRSPVSFRLEGSEVISQAIFDVSDRLPATFSATRCPKALLL